MSFGDSVRAELLAAVPQRACCRRSYLHGILVNAESGIEGMVMCRLRDGEIADVAAKLLLEQYGREPEIREENCYGRRIRIFEFESKRLAGFLSGLSDQQCTGGDISELKCPSCRGAFAAGVILSSARFSDPAKEARMEIAISDPSRVGRLIDFFGGTWSRPGLSQRSESSSLIFRKSAAVQDILSAAGAPGAAMEMIQGDLLREFRGNINRASNCEYRNIGRSVGASKIHMEAIKLLRDTGNFDALPDDLRETAVLREREPECSISELAKMHSPKISKSGVNHRLRRICDAADKLKK